MRSVMQHSFAQIPEANIPRSSFNRSHGFKTTFNSGYLVPVFVDEALPGDTLNLNMSCFGRLATPLTPFMDNLRLDSFFFAVPIRLIWQNWERFNGEQDNPDDSTDYLVPQMESPAATGYAVGSLSDYFGIPTGVAELSHCSFWHRAYNLVWNEWFRDQNLQDSVVVDVDDGPDDPADYVLLRRGKRHDYFTSALPWPQKGDAVRIPLGTRAPVLGIGKYNQTWTAGPAGPFNESNGQTRIYGQFNDIDPGNINSRFAVEGQVGGTSANYPNIFADLTDATAATINELRQAFQIQRMLERDARGGTRYTEIIRSHFGVVSPDARLQRPEYLGGGTTPINIHPVAQTSATNTEPTPQGNLAGFGTLSASGHGFTKSFTEHCVIIGMVSVRADLTYQQGLNRMWSRRTRYDFYWPTLSHLGEQAVLNKEIYAQGAANPTEDEEVFGYQERYAEYRYKPSLVTGQFRSSATTSLDTWHLAQDFMALPALDDTFIQDNPPVQRVLAVQSPYPEFLFDSYFSYRCARPMPTYSVPGLIDHF